MKILIKYILNLTLFSSVLINSVMANSVELPDFTKLVEDNKASIVNISTVRKKNNSNSVNPDIQNEELNDFLKKFFGDKGFEEPNKKKTKKITIHGFRFCILF